MAEGDDVRPLVHSNGNGIHKANGHSSPTRREGSGSGSIEDRLTSLEETVATMRDESREMRAGFDEQMNSLRNDMSELQSSFALMVELVRDLHARGPPPPPPPPPPQ